MGKEDRHAADHSPPSSVEAKNDRNSTSTPLYTFMEWTKKALPFFIDGNRGLCENEQISKKVFWRIWSDSL